MNITINDREIKFSPGETVLQVANRAGIRIPHLCSLDWAPSPSASCRLCVVEVAGSPRLQTSCTLQAAEGMVVHTHTPRVHEGPPLHRGADGGQPSPGLPGVRPLRELRAGRPHPRSGRPAPAIRGHEEGPAPGHLVAGHLPRSQQVRAVRALRHHVPSDPGGRRHRLHRPGLPHPGGAGLLGRHERVGLHLLRPVRAGLPHRRPDGAERTWTPWWPPSATRTRWWSLRSPRRSRPLSTRSGAGTTACRRCCSIWRPPSSASASPPCSIPGSPPTSPSWKKPTSWCERVQNGGVLPMFTSCSPAWVQYVELHRPDLIPHLSTCKSPQQMAGALIKEIYPKYAGLDGKRLVIVSLMPCTAKKFEAQDLGDVDYVLTTRELSALWGRFGIDFATFDERRSARSPVRRGHRRRPPLRRHRRGHGGGGAHGGHAAGRRGARRAAHRGPRPGRLQVLQRGSERDHAQPRSHQRAGPPALHSCRTALSDMHFVEVMSCPGGCVGRRRPALQRRHAGRP